LVVREDVKRRLSRLQNLEFVEVVIERLIDWAMPALGDFTDINADRPRRFDEFVREKLLTDPDVPEFHDKIGKYYTLLTANMHDLADRYDDIEQVTPDFGSYEPPSEDEPLRVSAKALKEYPILWDKSHILREDAFAILAPFLDLDYYGVAFMEYKPEPALQRYLDELKRSIEEDDNT
jgi:hypothetical protein